MISKQLPLYDLAEWKNGLAFRKIDFSNKGKPVIKIAELKNGITGQTQFTNGNYGEAVSLTRGDMVFSWSGNPETSIDVFWYDLPDGWLNQHIFKVTPSECVDKKYLYYLLKSLKSTFTAIASNKQTTGLGHVTIKDLKELIIDLPIRSTQEAISNYLYALDSKIHLNKQLNDNLQQQAQALYKHYFPYSVGDELPDGWRIGSVGEIIEIHDSKRVPLSGAERAKMEKKTYPYYGAAALMDYVDDYIFDGKYLLLGEDGTVVDNAGYPILQYVWGQFWVNNHAHILTGKLDFNVESLYMLFKQTPVKAIVTGAVQPKISQANLRSIQVVIPPEKLLMEYNYRVEPLFTLLRSNEAENKSLTALRDSLLPKLMSGEIDVSGIQL